MFVSMLDTDTGPTHLLSIQDSAPIGLDATRRSTPDGLVLQVAI